MLSGQDIWFAYHRPVFEGVSFELPEGQLVGLIGPNGCGKTTLLRILRNRIQPDRGQVFLAGKPVTRYSRRALAQAVGFVLQDHYVGFPLSVIEYVLQARYAYGGPFSFETDHDLKVAEHAMRLTDTWSFRSRQLDALSGGERQRVVLARALAGQPSVLLLDEPTANMDLAHQVATLALVKSLTVETGLTSVFVTHELNLASEFADRILILRDARIVADGHPRVVMTGENLRIAFGCEFAVDMNPVSGCPRVSVTHLSGLRSYRPVEL